MVHIGGGGSGDVFADFEIFFADQDQNAQPQPRVCKTEDGRSCVLPFRYFTSHSAQN